MSQRQPAIDMNAVVGARDIVLLTLDTLRYDVARDACAAGRTPNLAALLPGGAWELRHAPGSFTYASHQAMFAGFLPTPARPGKHPRLFALRFEGSETTSPTTCVLDAADVPSGLRARGYRTICIGGVGFFNKRNALGRVLPGLFEESHWSPATSVREKASTENQIALACRRLAEIPKAERVFLFVNVSALHQPNWFYLPEATPGVDTLASHAAALAYVDGELPPLFDALRARGGALVVVCSDHGTAYGDDGFQGHRLAHPCVWNVPYAHFMLEGA
jgi:hypothetical protein